MATAFKDVSYYVKIRRKFGYEAAEAVHVPRKFHESPRARSATRSAGCGGWKGRQDLPNL